MSLEAVVRAARRRLADSGIETAALDARVLAAAAFGLDAAGLIARAAEEPGPDAVRRFEALVARRLAGEPVGRILGRREFHGLEIDLSPETLEPRPDTETLVEAVLALVRGGRLPGVGADGAGLLFVDVGTGTGAIALALLAALPAARGIATDISAGALATAGRNATRLGLADRLELRQGDMLAPVVERASLIVSNPPYIETAAIADLAPEVRHHDPVLALDGGPDGLDAYRALAAGAGARLVPGGVLAVEIGSTQANAVSGLFSAAGLAETQVMTDIAGRDRVVLSRQPT